MTDPVHEFRNPKLTRQRGEPHLDIEVWENGVRTGYIDIHAHKVSDGSLSVGVTVRHGTKKKPPRNTNNPG